MPNPKDMHQSFIDSHFGTGKMEDLHRKEWEQRLSVPLRTASEGKKPLKKWTADELETGFTRNMRKDTPAGADSVARIESEQERRNRFPAQKATPKKP